MATPINKNTKPTKRDWLRKPSVLITLVILTLVALYIGFAVWNIVDNRAADLAAPLERSLSTSGATKVCNDGDPGRGPDNTQPWYEVAYDVQMTKDNAIALVKRVAKDNGYTLSPVGQGNQSHLSVTSDDSKQQPYGDIDTGPINLAFTIDGPGPVYTCRTSNTIQSGHIMISFGIRLPNFKR